MERFKTYCTNCEEITQHVDNGYCIQCGKHADNYTKIHPNLPNEVSNLVIGMMNILADGMDID